MGVIAEAVRHLLAAGVTGDALIQAIADMEGGVHEVITDFDDFWSIYPKNNGSKTSARKAYGRAIKYAGPQEIRRGVERYAAYCQGRDIEFIKHAATWLNQRCWEVEYSTSNAQPKPTGNDKFMAIAHRLLSEGKGKG